MLPLVSCCNVAYGMKCVERYLGIPVFRVLVYALVYVVYTKGLEVGQPGSGGES